MKSRSPDLTVGFPRESGTERRTICTPALASALAQAGFGIVAEPGIGDGVFIGDDAYTAAGVRFADPEQVWAMPLVLRYKSPDPADLGRLSAGQHIGALFHAEGDADLMAALQVTGVTAWSYEFVAENGRFPLGRPGGQIAGIQAVLAGAQALQHPAGRGVLLARVDGAAPADVVVIGSGNVGTAAARTAAALGAQVVVLTGSDASRDVYEQVAPYGVRVLVNSRQALLSCLKDADLVIGAILVSTFDTPPMITDVDLGVMRPGAVIVDATCGYGTGYLPTAGPVQQPGDMPRLVGGILHVKVDVWPASVPVTATAAYTDNAAPYLVRLARTTLLGEEDPVVRAALIAHGGYLVHPVLVQHARFYGLRP
ncbi:NAD(P)-dependent oxidoreductase [Streptosporangium saharense]|uniref:NAD(P)-dependent oxidoreductase n=1 Tax=Streptosporangium saharense TaxID=1706840 RepID=UPI00369457D2